MLEYIDMPQVKFIRNKEILKEKVNHKNNVVKEVILKNGELPNLLQLARAKLLCGDKIEKHSHESMNEIFYVLSGELFVIENNITTKVSSGDTFVVYAKQYHSIEAIKDTELIYFNLDSN